MITNNSWQIHLTKEEAEHVKHILDRRLAPVCFTKYNKEDPLCNPDNMICTSCIKLHKKGIVIDCGETVKEQMKKW